MKITKTQQIIAGVIGATLIIVGGTTIKKQQDEVAAKKAAELAYANRPIIEQSCVMNGLGEGECNFTNSGKTEGAKCGTINVQKPGVVQSDKFCSGMVEPMSTEKVEFKIPAVDELCDNGFEDWRDKCSFDFYEAAPNGAATTSV
jgi:hypothetical protein